MTSRILNSIMVSFHSGCNLDPFMIFKSPLSVNDWSHLEQANGVFHALSKCHSSWMSCHISNRQMTSLLCGSFHDFQITTICKWLVTFGTGVFHTLPKCQSAECFVTFRTGKWLLSCVDPFMIFKSQPSVNDWSQLEQANGVFRALSKCHSSRMSRHISNSQMTSLLCISFHDFKITNICKWLVTFGTGKGSLSWSFNVPLQLNVFSHFEQANDFSLVWILSWFSNHHFLY